MTGVGTRSVGWDGLLPRDSGRLGDERYVTGDTVDGSEIPRSPVEFGW